MSKATKEVTTQASAEALAALAAMFPQADSYNRTQFPKLVFKSQTKFGDKLDKAGKPVLDEDGEPEQVVLIKAGTFFIEKQTEEKDEKGKAIWNSEEIGKTLDGHIVFIRKRLQYWDAINEDFISSPMYDNNNEVIPLFKSGEFIAEGTPAELRAMYPEIKEYTDKKTDEKKQKTVSKLKDAKVLYIILNGELVELTIAGSSMWEFESYLKKTAVPACITTFSSTKEEQGATKWNKMSFKVLRDPSAEEATNALEIAQQLLKGIENEKDFYARKRAENAAAAAPALAAASEAAPLALEGGSDDEEDF
jgi:hypothetical protein